MQGQPRGLMGTVPAFDRDQPWAFGKRLVSVEQVQPHMEHLQFSEGQGKDFLTLWLPSCQQPPRTAASCDIQHWLGTPTGLLAQQVHGLDLYAGWHLKADKEKITALTHKCLL